jgi:glyoxylase-like metal-dependent hydrolase (beta-lactamase superfamily II)
VSTPTDGRLAVLRAGDYSGPGYEVLALRYGTCLTTRARCFLGYELYGEEDASQRMDFFVWVLRSPETTIVVDTGFDPGAAARRGRTCLISPPEALALAGVRPAAVEHVVLTHLHYDHVGNLDAFPRASFDVQGREIDFWDGPYASRGQFAAFVERPELAAIKSAERARRIRRLDGDSAIAPGVMAFWTGGHTPGQQIVVVRGRRSLVVLASDALHFYEELDADRPFAVLSNLTELYAGYDLLRGLAAIGATIVPGHDPAVLDRFPRMPGTLAEIGVRVG